MARHSFIQMSKLPNVKGRISYITSHARQENLYATYRTADNAFWSNLARESQQEFQRSGAEGKCIVSKAKGFLQNLIREHEMPPKPTLSINMTEFRSMRNLIIRVQDEARAIRSLQEEVPKLKKTAFRSKGHFQRQGVQGSYRADTANRKGNI